MTHLDFIKKTTTMRKFIQLVVFALVLGLLPACEEEYFNPSTLSEAEAVSSVDALISLVNGIQYRYSVGRQSPVYTTVTASGFTTGELAILNPGNTDENFLSIGGAQVAGNNGVVTNLWTQLNIIRANADLVIGAASSLGDAGTRAGLLAYASIYKALALGGLAQFFERVPLTGGTNATFSTREEALREAIRILNTARTEITANPVPSSFTSRTTNSVNLPNTINALIARYSLMVNDLDGALAAANAVSLTVTSRLIFDDIARNPIFDVSLSNINVYQPLNANLGLPTAIAPDANDARVLFYLQSKTATNNIFRGKGFFTANNSPIPLYLPGEMILIKAEVFARKNQLTEAKAELDKVLTKTAAQDAYGVGAGLPAYAGPLTQADLLREIYRNRCIELFMSGLKLEDSRRFGRPAPGTAGAERNRNFYPYPNAERDNNTNTPPDPTI